MRFITWEEFMLKAVLALSVAGLSFAMPAKVFGATEIQWWHAMTGANNEVVDQLTKEFNESQRL
jgi:sn-glycerol 3-phosphate transport system substrate-binding protein